MNKCTYSPQISPGNSELTAPPASLPVVLVSRDTIVLTYPYVSPTLTVEIRNPELNDKEAHQFKRIVSVTRGNKLIVKRNQNWPRSTRLSYNFIALSKEQAYDILDFIKESLGKEIGLLDYESKQWKGIIISPNEPITQEGPGCMYSAKFDFQGVLV